MIIELNQVKPVYMSASELKGSDIYLQDCVVFESGKKYLIKANSGHGKTSILNFIYGTNHLFEGYIRYDKKNEQSAFSFRKDKLSYVFQDFKLFPELTLLENIQLKNNLTGYKSRASIEELINRVNLRHRINHPLKNLSLGQKQRVSIIRALCQPIQFLLLDEPFSHLDHENIQTLTDIIREEVDQQQAGLILTSLGSEYLFNYDSVLNL